MKTTAVTIDLGSSGVLSEMMVNRGAPRHMLRGSLSVDEGTVAAATHAAFRPIPPRTQLGQLAKAMAAPSSGSYLFVIGSSYDENLCQSIALGIMKAGMARSIGNPGAYPRPYWHPVYGGWRDRLRDDEAFRVGVGRVGLLIVSNVADNSTPAKIEAARDLLTMYSSVPRVLVISGADPLAFSIDILRRRPTRVLHISSTAKRKRLGRSI